MLILEDRYSLLLFSPVNNLPSLGILQRLSLKGDLSVLHEQLNQQMKVKVCLCSVEVSIEFRLDMMALLFLLA